MENTFDKEKKPGESSFQKKYVMIVIFLALFLLIVFFTKNNNTKTKNEISSPLPTPMPYRELTIPYLRSKVYSSSLTIANHIYDYSDYDGYLASYVSEKLKINGLLTIPKGKKPTAGWPAIVFVHGYIPPSQYKTLEKYVAYVDYLAKNGFVVFKIDLRGHGDSQGKAGGGYFSSDYLIDTLNAYAALQSSDFVNPEAIGLWGHSMAGNTILRSMTVKPEIPAAVIWAGAVYSYTDQQKYGIHDASYQRLGTGRPPRQQGVFAVYGQPTDTNFFWKMVAPTNYLNDIKGAIEINHAEDDETVNIGYSKDLIALLDRTHVPHKFYTYPTGGHNITDPSFSLAMQRTVDFFHTYLK